MSKTEIIDRIERICELALGKFKAVRIQTISKLKGDTKVYCINGNYYSNMYIYSFEFTKFINWYNSIKDMVSIFIIGHGPLYSMKGPAYKIIETWNQGQLYKNMYYNYDTQSTVIFIYKEHIRPSSYDPYVIYSNDTIPFLSM